MLKIKNWGSVELLIALLLFPLCCFAKQDLSRSLNCLIQAYPDSIVAANASAIRWQDGSVMPLFEAGKPTKTLTERLNSPALIDQLQQAPYPQGKPRFHDLPRHDPGRIRYQAFFTKLYGETEAEVKSKLVDFYWMPKIFGKRYLFQVTTVNGVNKKLIKISNALEVLVLKHPDFLKYLDNPGGLFKWRTIANTQRLSPHSFGITVDINTQYSDYWQWDLAHQHRAIDETAVLSYKNQIPWAIVQIFEQQGFIWGGKWKHYDTMHFEYRPEILCQRG